jgi:hypothetical protein
MGKETGALWRGKKNALLVLRPLSSMTLTIWNYIAASNLTMAEFILLIREDLSKYPMPEAELKSLTNAHTQWAKDLSKRGIFKTGYGVDHNGKVLGLVKGKLTAKPIKDVKEGIGGFYIIEAEDLDAAVEIAKECPTYKTGDQMEVRPLM